MDRSLTQAEIDSLVRQLVHGGGESAEVERDAPRPYDFRKGKQLARDQLRFIERLYEQFARALSNQLMQRLGGGIEITLRSLQEVTYGEFSSTIPSAVSNLSVSVAYEAEPMGGYVFIQFNPDLVFALFDRLMGGGGEPWKKLRELTEIELAVLRRQIFDLFGEAMGTVWSTIVEDIVFHTRLTHHDAFYVDQYLGRDRVLVASFTGSIGALSDIFNVCMPYAFLEPLVPRLTDSFVLRSNRAPDPEESERLHRALRRAKVRVRALLGATTLNVEELLRLSVGDVIPLNSRVDDPLDLLVAGRRKFVGSPGRVGRSLALMITGPVKGEEADG